MVCDSSQTTLTNVMNDLLLTLADFQIPPVLLLLDLSVAFATTGHSILQTN